MKIEYVDTDKIKEYDQNTKIHTDKQIEMIANSIQAFGWKQPIVIDKDYTVTVGHGRLNAARFLGLKQVPCIIADDLTEDEIRAYRLADNKLNESTWDKKMLSAELPEIELDMSMFDFDFELEHIEHKEKTEERVRDILNLEKAQYPGTGLYDIPILKPVKRLPKIKEWIGFNYVLSDDNPEGKAVHFFIDDYQFERLWNNPDKYIDKLKQYVCVATPDFSPYGDMPHVLQIYNHYRKHWIGAYMQENGIKVIPTIRCSTDPRSMDWYLDGEPKGGIVLISSMWTKNADIATESAQEYKTMREVLKPCKTFIYGGYSEYMDIEESDNVEYIQSFTEKRWG